MPLNPKDVVEDGEITNTYNQHTSRTKPSAGVDVDKRGLPEGARADVHTPVGGTVTKISPNWGMVQITDSDGNKHEFVHLDLSAPHVTVGTAVSPGDRIGAMGNTVPDGVTTPKDHVHYQIKSSTGTNINPETFDFDSRGS